MAGLICPGFLVLLVAILVLYFIEKGKRREAAYKAYRAGLANLTDDPNNPELRKRVLRLGREYSELMRGELGRTTFDEIALKNDIDAACAGAVNFHGRSIEDRLSKLQQLRADGYIDDAEYDRRRRSILDEI